LRIHVKLMLGLVLPLLFLACGTSGAPFEMANSVTMVVGDPDNLSFEKFITNGQEKTATGVVTAQIDQEFNNRRVLVIESFNASTDFDGVGTISVVLNPNLDSSATIFKLNTDNQPSGTNTMTLNLIVETPDQNLTYDNVELSGQNATLTLSQGLASIGFILNGQNKVLQTLGLTVQVPASLITSDDDPL